MDAQLLQRLSVIAHLPLINTISDDQMWLLADRFQITPREGYLSARN